MRISAVTAIALWTNEATSLTLDQVNQELARNIALPINPNDIPTLQRSGNRLLLGIAPGTTRDLQSPFAQRDASIGQTQFWMTDTARIFYFRRCTTSQYLSRSDRPLNIVVLQEDLARCSNSEGFHSIGWERQLIDGSWLTVLLFESEFRPTWDFNTVQRSLFLSPIHIEGPRQFHVRGMEFIDAQEMPGIRFSGNTWVNDDGGAQSTQVEVVITWIPIDGPRVKLDPCIAFHRSMTCPVHGGNQFTSIDQ